MGNDRENKRHLKLRNDWPDKKIRRYATIKKKEALRKKRQQLDLLKKLEGK